MRRKTARIENFMEKAEIISKLSVCLYFQIGAVFVTDDNMYELVSGYNGPASGEPHCDEVGCAKIDENGNFLLTNSGRCRGCHAEMNAIINAARRGISIKGTIAYCTSSPCRQCAKHLINLPIIRFVFAKKYETDFEEVKKMFERRKIEFIEFGE